MNGRLCGVVLACGLLGGCASMVATGSGRGGMAADGRSYEEARADQQITAAINGRLVHDPVVRALDITVRTRDGVVWLDGRAASVTAARRAAALAGGVAGVRRVINRLVVPTGR